MSAPFWQMSFETLSYAEVSGFLAQGIPENEHLEYKAPSFNKQNKKYEFTETLLQTLVAFANSGGGLLIYGVDDGVHSRPGAVTGVPPEPGRDPDVVLRNRCAGEIEPRIALETRVVTIPDEAESGGNWLLLVRVRPGPLPPYNGRKFGIYLRDHEADRLATVREIEALFARRVVTGASEEAPWAQVLTHVFGYETLMPSGHAHYLMVGLTPAFPATPVPSGDESDAQFERLCLHLFRRSDFVFRLPRGIMYAPYRDEAHQEDGRYGCAFDDGSVGFRVFLGDARGYRLDLGGVWEMMRRVLTLAEEWPRTVCEYHGPLVCRLALANLTDVVVRTPGSPRSQDIPVAFRNKLPSWHAETEWGTGGDVDDLIERALAALARQLQFPRYDAIKQELRAAVNA